MEGDLFTEIRKLVGDKVAMQIQEMIQHVVSSQNSFMVNAIGVVVMALGVTSVFAEVQGAHNYPEKGILKLFNAAHILIYFFTN